MEPERMWRRVRMTPTRAPKRRYWGLAAPEEADSEDFSASEENESEIWMKGGSCYEVTE